MSAVKGCPIGSRWRWRSSAHDAVGIFPSYIGPEFTVVGPDDSGGYVLIRYEDVGTSSSRRMVDIIDHATRIDITSTAPGQAYVQPIVYEPRPDEAWAEHLRQERAIAKSMRDELEAEDLRAWDRSRARAFLGDAYEPRFVAMGINVIKTPRRR